MDMAASAGTPGSMSSSVAIYWVAWLPKLCRRCCRLLMPKAAGGEGAVVLLCCGGIALVRLQRGNQFRLLHVEIGGGAVVEAYLRNPQAFRLQ